MEVMSVLRPKEQVRRILLRLAHVETHHVQCTGAFEVYAIEREEAFLYERTSIGDDGVSGRLSDHFDAHTGFDEYAVGVFTHFSGDNESWHSSKCKKNKTIDAMPKAEI